jgi:hypothetical protein
MKGEEMDGRYVGTYEPESPNPADADHAAGLSRALQLAFEQVESSDLESYRPPETADERDTGKTWTVEFFVDLVPGSTEVLRYRAKIQVADWPL